jgi:hypothetical protein
MLALLALTGCALLRAAPLPVSAGNGTIIVGTFPNQFWIVDEASEKVVGRIPFTSGMPRRTSLSRDRTRLYTIEAAMEKVEVIDLARRSTIDTFTLSEGNTRVRIRSLEPDEEEGSVVSDLLETNPRFRELVERSKAGPRKDFIPRARE